MAGPFWRDERVCAQGLQIDAALAELGLPVLDSRTSDRVAYTHAGNEGTSVLAGLDRTARNEILAIRRELEQLAHDDH